MANNDIDATGETESSRSGERIGIEVLPGGSRLAALRTDVVSKYRGYMTLDTADKTELDRWGLGSIVSHWLLVLCMLSAIVSGIAFWTGWYGAMDIGIWDGYQVAFQLHVWSGVLLAVIAVVVFPFYHRVVDGHELLVSREQLKEEIVVALSFVGLMRYIPGYKQARRAYDEDRDEWVGYHPMQTVFWYVTWFFVLALTLTGFALWRSLSTDPSWWIGVLGFMDGWVAYETMLQLHLLATFWVLAAIAVHVYFAITPGNWDILRSMVVGSVEGWRVDEVCRPESETATKRERDKSVTQGEQGTDD